MKEERGGKCRDETIMFLIHAPQRTLNPNPISSHCSSNGNKNLEGRGYGTNNSPQSAPRAFQPTCVDHTFVYADVANVLPTWTWREPSSRSAACSRDRDAQDDHRSRAILWESDCFYQYTDEHAIANFFDTFPRTTGFPQVYLHRHQSTPEQHASWTAAYTAQRLATSVGPVRCCLQQLHCLV